jgi:hypothetical protein
MTQREDVPHEIEDDGGLLYNVERTQGGSLTAMVRVWGHLTVGGVPYEYDRNIRVKLKRCKE